MSPLLSPASWRGAIRNAARLLEIHWTLLVRERRLRKAARRAGARLPPGSLRPGDTSLHANQRHALQLADRHGPVFKLIDDNQWTTCIVGLDRGRRLLLEHEAALPGLTVDLEPLFPGGALRGMEGERHKTYRRVLLQALQATPMSAHADTIRASIEPALEALTHGEVRGAEIRSVLREATGSIMLGVIYGLTPASPRFGPIRQAYRRFGPVVPAYQIEEDNRRAFLELLDLARAVAEEIRVSPTSAPPSMLKHMVVAGTLDDTALGNLVNLFESSHFDMYSLAHWMLWYLAREPQLRDRLRNLPEGSAEANRLTEAIVLETLRLNQSEVLLRQTTCDLRFDGFLIPGGTRVRVCLWESHKDGRLFPDPFRFDPERFLARNHDIEEYAPFGLDKRRCIGTDVVLAVSQVFAERLLRDHEVEIISDGPAVRGAYHWEPSPAFAVRVKKRRERSGMVGDGRG